MSRIDDPGDLLSLRRTLAVIAPNNVVRAELRGMLGWMAALSSEPTQLGIVELDPYAVLANGDPSQLSAKAKKSLIVNLAKLSRAYPHFRRGDVWRKFNVGGFFTKEIQADIASILISRDTTETLRQLVLELIQSSASASQFTSELRSLVLDAEGDPRVRRSANSVLNEVQNEHLALDLATLLAEASTISLELAARTVRIVGAITATAPVVVDLLFKLAGQYPKRRQRDNNFSNVRHHIYRLIDCLDLDMVEAALDGLTLTQTCSCEPKRQSRCDCHVGISEIARRLLNRYFALGAQPDPTILWGWLRHRHFSGFRANDEDDAVAALADAHDIRRQIQWRILSDHSDAEKVDEAVRYLFARIFHSGLAFQAGDMESLAQRAFLERNLLVWNALWRAHNRHDPTSRANPMRTLQRQHALQDPSFMKAWARQAALWREVERRERIRTRRRRYEIREAKAGAQERTDLVRQRTIIEAGEHWGWLRHFAYLYLLEPEQLAANPDFGETPSRAIRNCIPMLTPHVPTLQTLRVGDSTVIATVLLAHCILRFREKAPLGDLPLPILRAAATEMGNYPTIDSELEREAIEAEFARLVFSRPGAPEEFARDFIEPALRLKASIASHIHWLRDKPAFHHLRATLPLEWLEKYPQMPRQEAKALLKMASEFGERTQLNKLIDRRFQDPSVSLSEDTDSAKDEDARHRYWAMNAFLYGTEAGSKAWEELQQDENNIFAIEDRIGLIFGPDNEGAVPSLSAQTIFLILDSFVGRWPRVPLSDNFGTDSPKDERAYRFLDRLVWRIADDTPSRKLPVIERMLQSTNFADFQDSLLTMQAEARRQLALQDFRPPSPYVVCAYLDSSEIASVEDLRALLLEQLAEIQADLKGLETNPIAMFYSGGKRVDENTGRDRIVDLLRPRMRALGFSVVIEHHMAHGNRCDFTVSAAIPGARILLVVEVKGQWNTALFSAASAQLMDRYAIHPDAAQQGIYLVFWYARDGGSIAGRSEPDIISAEALKAKILSHLSEDLAAAISVVVLDVSRANALQSSQQIGEA